MSPRIEQALHSIAAVILLVAAFAAVVGVGYWLGGLQGLRGTAFDSWMLWASGIGLVVGFVTFFAYQRWVMPNHVREMQGLLPKESLASTLEHRRRVAEFAAHQDALRATLRATPGLERYAELIGRSTIATVDDALQRAERVNELASDTVKAKYAERVFNGEVITDRQIAYWEDRAARVLCVHLAALETDVRAASPSAHPVADAVLESDRDLDFEALRKRYSLVDPPITFWHRPFGPEFYGRAEENYDGLQRIHCTQHECTLQGASEHRPKFPADV
jgi:hypothetical protein